ncbi:MAG: ABC transporter permease [Puniceicoccales bacterium]|jgi:phospholipid/cholesterol/gamma-HCH transport system permease protein|nr:ABC transporter permease [Puniceicoccales bacterium]
MSTHPPLLRYHRSSQGPAVTLSISGTWTLWDSIPPWEETQLYLQQAELPEKSIIELDSHNLEKWDSVFLAFIRKLRELCRQNRWQLHEKQLPESISKILDGIVPKTSTFQHSHTSFSFSKVLKLTFQPFHHILDFIGRLYLSCGNFLRGQVVFQWHDFCTCLQQVTVEALPIVTLISFLIGLILTFVSLIQLDKFGAGIYVADLVGLAMTREMGCLTIGIIMSGRTGAAFAATLGTMKVNEEIDALETFQIPSIDFLVVPRIIATIIAMPCLCIFADFIGIFSGFCVAWNTADIHPLLYLAQTKHALTPMNLFIGIFKSTFFGLIISVVGCYYGLRCEKDTSAVGTATTSAVVAGITWIIASDAVFAIILAFLEI